MIEGNILVYTHTDLDGYGSNLICNYIENNYDNIKFTIKNLNQKMLILQTVPAEEKPLSGRGWDCGFVSDSLYAAFPHLYFAGQPQLAERFVTAARRCREKEG